MGGPSLHKLERNERADNMQSTRFERGDTVRVVSGPYEGVVGSLIGPATGGDLAISVLDAGTARARADVREGETLYVWPTEVGVEGL